MSDNQEPVDLSEKARDASFPGWIVGVVVALMLVGFYLAGRRSESGPAKLTSQQEQEIQADRAALDAQKQKVVEITDQLATLEGQIGNLQGAKRKAMKDQYNALSLQQNAERDKWTQMAQQYNEKLSRYQQR